MAFLKEAAHARKVEGAKQGAAITNHRIALPPAGGKAEKRQARTASAQAKVSGSSARSVERLTRRIFTPWERGA
ncbi:hypothetical protein [Cupriavidus sp. D384]|uniref:hypothetical protein n=1 Tax=Cupriavidus sp. D384 TaxID=1538095 RepID=UPI000B13F846|nr:hypothetical protein [Cupriavidus sp. D384]